MKRLTQYFILFLLSFLLFGSTSSPIYAQSTAGWYDLGYPENIENANTGSINAAAHVSNVNTNTYSDFIRRVLGPVPGVTITASAMNTPYAETMRKQSAIAGISNYIYAMYTSPPASTYAFIQDMGQTLGFIPKQAYAQGIGFSSFSAILPIWKVFRNISYSLLAIVLVVIGFMVMFRKKIDPKTVVTVQNALPRIVITLLLITFSYALVGLAIDFMYVLLAIIGNMFQQTGMLPKPPSFYTDGGIAKIMDNIVPSTQLISRVLFGSPTMRFEGLTMGAAGILAVIATFIAPWVWVAAGAAAAPSVLVCLVLSIAMLILWIRLIVYFINAYVQIILALIFAPLQLLVEVVPGSNAFDSWIRNLIGNILIFPASAALFMLAAIFFNMTDNQHLWNAPYTALIIENTVNAATILGLGILFMIPSIGKQIKELLKAKPINLGGNTGVGPALSVGTQIIQTVSSARTLFPKNLPGGEKTK